MLRTDQQTRRPKDQVLVQISPEQYHSAPSPTASPATVHTVVTKHDQKGDMDGPNNRAPMHSLYHIDSDPNLNNVQEEFTPTRRSMSSYKDATMIDMTEYSPDKNENKDGEDAVVNGSEHGHKFHHHRQQQRQQQKLGSAQEQLFAPTTTTTTTTTPTTTAATAASGSGLQKHLRSTIAQQPHSSSSLFNFFRGRKSSIPKSSGATQPATTTTSVTATVAPTNIAPAGSAQTSMTTLTASEQPVQAAPIMGTNPPPPPITRRRILSPENKSSSDAESYHRGSVNLSSNTTQSGTIDNNNTNSNLSSGNKDRSNSINKRGTVGTLPMTTRTERYMSTLSNRASNASSISASASSVLVSTPLRTSSDLPSVLSSGSLSTITSSTTLQHGINPSTTSQPSTAAAIAIPAAVSSTGAPSTSSSVAEATASISASLTVSPSIANTAHLTFTKVAAAVVGATVGKRRPPSASNGTQSDNEAAGGGGGISKFGGLVSKQQLHQQQQQQPCQLPLISPGLKNKRDSSIQASPVRQGLVGLDQEQLNQHATFMKGEKSISDLREYISQLYKTILGKDEALEHSRKQISTLNDELNQARAHAEEDKKALTEEVDRVKEQIVTMEENFLLWRTKVHNDQMVLQEDFMNERLDKQDRIDELEEDLTASQEEADRLRSRLLVLEYEDGYVGPSSFLPDDEIGDLSMSMSSSSSSIDSLTKNKEQNEHVLGNGDRGSSVSIPIEIFTPITIDSHKRRSADFKILEQRTQSLETIIQELRTTLESERQEHQRGLIESRSQMQTQYTKLEEQLQAAKMESTMYTEMMHEVVTENDDLRRRVKSANRTMRRHGWSDPRKDDSANSANSAYSASTSASTSTSRSNSHRSSMRSLQPRNSDYFAYPAGFGEDDNESLYGSEDDLEEIMI
ncbi:hypothetical protein BGX28_006970 [Mortierella sp. GBA30]|nr:hypothetical protein BGX28_006970 [Mortierella sp. GBA30]